MTQVTRFVAVPAALWASAFVLGGLLIVEAGRLPANSAFADVAVSGGDFTLLTADSGRGDDEAPDELLWILDSRAEVILVYEIEDARKKQIIMHGGANLQTLFGNARR